MPSSGAPVELLERDDELAQLAESAERARSEGRFVGLRGPAGVGKTALLQAGVEIMRQSGFRVLRARGGEIERELGFGVVRQLFHPLLVSGPEARVSELFAGTASLARIALLEEPTGGGPTSPNDYSPLYGLYWLVAGIAQRSPVALVIDDLHWADAASLRFVLFMLRRLHDLPLLLVAAWRDGSDLDPGQLLSAAGERERVLITPAPLSRKAVATLMQRELGAAMSDRLAEDCGRVTGGNPLLVHAVLRQLAANPGRAVDELDITPAEPLTSSIFAQLRTLGPAAGAVAEAVAVLGDACTLRRAARLCGLGEDVAAASMRQLVGATICTDGPQPAFVHPLVRDVVYRHSDVLGIERHGRAAAVLRDDRAAIEQVALQLGAALALPPGDWPVEYLVGAAAQLSERGAPDSAATFLRVALTAELAAGKRSTLLLLLGIAESRSGSPQAVTHLDEARQSASEPAQRVQAALALARALYASGSVALAVAVLDAELREAADAEGSDQLPHSLALLVEELRTLGDVDLACRPLVQSTLGTALPATAGTTIAARDAAHRAVGLLIDGASAADCSQAAGLALADGSLLDDALRGDPLFFITCFAATCADGFAIALPALDRAVAETQRRGDALTYCLASVQRALLHVRRGDLIAAEADARSALDTFEINGWQPLEQMAVTVLVYVAVETDQLGTVEKEPLLDDPTLDGNELTTQGAVLLEARGRLRLAQRDDERAASDLLRAGQTFTGWGMRNPGPFAWRSCAAMPLHRLKRHEEATALCEEELSLARRWGAARSISLALRALSHHGDSSRRLTLLEEAVAVTSGSPALLERARALVELGAELRRANHRAAARTPLSEGLELARNCGALPLAEAAHRELWATGARPRTPRRLGIDALTASERRVADLACDELSNPEIAQALFVSTKTVEMHLTSVFRKLQVTGRAALAEALQRDR